MDTGDHVISVVLLRRKFHFHLGRPAKLSSDSGRFFLVVFQYETDAAVCLQESRVDL